MNVTELARKLKINTKQLLEILPEHGFDIGKRSIKIDDQMADQVIRRWKYIKKAIEDKKLEELEVQKEKEKELRREEGKTVTLSEDIISVRDFADRLDMSVTTVITELMKSGILANQNQNIDHETATIMAEDLGFTITKEQSHGIVYDDRCEEALQKALTFGEHTESRPPVVVIMGHVDHGKTSLLDTIRKANIISTESGGITQHIGAYQTIWKDPKTEEERPITFIDTPGHEAFTVMRSRGAKVADIAILIVAADDGVKPQTKEVIQIIKAAKLPFIVAINKIDKEGANVERTKTDLSQHGVLAEEWGGDIAMVEISAKQNLHIDKLLDMLLLVTDMNVENIQADPSIPAIGTVIESHVDKGMGPVATILVQAGTLQKNDVLVVDNEIYGKVRAMKDYNGENVDSAGPSFPVQIIGFKVAPEMGDILDVSQAKTAHKIDVKAKRNEQTGADKRSVVSSHSEEDEDVKKKTVNIVLKSDVLGSLEAIIGSLEKFRHDEVGVKIVGKGLGNITENDVSKAESAGATVVGFKVNPTPLAEESMRERGVAFKRYDIIYDLIDWVRDELAKLLDSEEIVHELGIFKVLAIFRTDKKAMTIGGRVEDGKVKKGSLVRVKRDGEIIAEGSISQLQSGTQIVKEVPSGSECGLRFEGKEKIAVDDVLEIYEIESKVRELFFN